MPARIRVLMLGPGMKVRGGVTAVEKLILAHMPDAVELRFIATMEEGSGAKKAIVFAWAFLRTLGLLLRGWPDVFHLHFTSRGGSLRKMILARTAMLFRRKVILHGHGGEFHKFIERLRPSYRNWTLKTLHRADGVLCLSNSWRKYYLSLGIAPERLLAFPNPTRLPEAIPERPERTTVQLVFLGLMAQEKGVYDLIEAVSMLPESVRERVCVVMAGNGELDKVQAMLERLNLLRQFEVKDWISPEERDQLYSESDALLLPSYVEGLPMTVLEAMSYGLAVITTPVGGIPEYIKTGESGLLVEPGDVKALSDAIRTIVEDSQLRTSLGRKGRTMVEPLDVNIYCRKLVHIYENIMNGRPPSAGVE